MTQSNHSISSRALTDQMQFQPSWAFLKVCKKNAKVQLQDSKQKWRQASLAPAWGGQFPNGLPAELFFTGLMDISDGHRADNPEDSCASVKRSQIAPYGAVWPFHLCLLRRDVRVCGGGIFLLLAQNLISILRKMHQHSLSVPQNRPCHAEPPNESRSDSESTHSSSFLIEEAALSLSE